MLIGEEHLRLLIGKSLLETITDAEVEAKSAALSGEHPTLSADQANMLARAQLEKAEADSDEAEEESQDDELGRRPKGMEEGWTDQDSDSFRTWMNTNRMTRQRAKKMNLELPEDMREKYGEDSDTYIDRANNQHVVAAYNKRSPRNSDGYGAEWLEQAIAKYDSRREELDAERSVRDNLEKGFGPIDTFDKFLQMRLNQANHKASIDANQGENVDTLQPVVPIRDLSSRYRLGLGITYLYHVNEFDGMGGANTDDHVQVPANRIKSLWSPSSTVMLAQPGFDPDAKPTENEPLPRLQYKEPQVDGAISLAYDPKTEELFMRQVQKDGEWEVVIKDVPYNNGFLWLRRASNEGRTEEAEQGTAATAAAAGTAAAGTAGGNVVSEYGKNALKQLDLGSPGEEGSFVLAWDHYEDGDYTYTCSPSGRLVVSTGGDWDAVGDGAVEDSLDSPVGADGMNDVTDLIKWLGGEDTGNAYKRAVVATAGYNEDGSETGYVDAISWVLAKYYAAEGTALLKVVDGVVAIKAGTKRAKKNLQSMLKKANVADIDLGSLTASPK